MKYNNLGLKETCLNCKKKSCALSGVGNVAKVNENDGCWQGSEIQALPNVKKNCKGG